MTTPTTPPPSGPMATNPVLVVLGGLAAVIGAGLFMLNALHAVSLDAGQIGAVVTFTTAATGLAAAALRAKVDSPATVQTKVQQALLTPVPDGPTGGTP